MPTNYESKKSFPLINTFEFKHSIKIGSTTINKEQKTIIAGPCTIESYNQLKIIAQCLVQNDIKIIRGGAFKPRSSPYSFQGLGQEGLEILATIKKEFNLLSISEILNTEHIDFYNEVDILQVGARNMQNTALLKVVANSGKPVFLKRGFGNSLHEWLWSAEYLASFGAKQIILCERGSTTFNKETRYTLDLGIAILAQKYSNLLVFADPSHASGRSDIVPNLATASLASGLDGIMIEIHNNKETASCDGEQALSLQEFTNLVQKLKNHMFFN